MSEQHIHVYLHIVPTESSTGEKIDPRMQQPGLPSDKWQQKQSGNGKRRKRKPVDRQLELEKTTERDAESFLEQLPKRRGRPKGSKNKPKPFNEASWDDLEARARRGRPKGSRNKPKEEKYVFGEGYTQPKKRGRPFGSRNKPKTQFVE